MNSTSDELFLTSSKKSKEAYVKTVRSAAEAVAKSVHASGKAYSGPAPEDLRKIIRSIEFFPEEGLGFEKVLEDAEKNVLPYFLLPSSTSYMAHLHSPAVLEGIASEVIISTFNQSMDSWDQSPVATEMEAEAARQLCRLYDFGENSDGVFTSGGSQSNQCGINMARDWYCRTQLNWDVKKHGLPADFRRLRLYTSEISHFSMEKSAHLLGLGYEAVVKVPVDNRMRMDFSALKKLVEADVKAGNLPFCVVATIGTTDFGSIDPIKDVRKLCDEHHMWLHADAAYGSGLVLSKKYNARIDGINLADSLTVDFHKMFLLPISGSAVLVKDKDEFKTFEIHADYLNREEDEEEGYINLVGKSVQTTRRFDALKVWIAFRTRGRKGWSEIIDTCVENAEYFYEKLSSDGDFTSPVKPEISSVVFRFNASDDVNKRVRRRLLLHEGVVIGQTVANGQTCLKFTLLNPLLTHERLDEILELIRKLSKEELSSARS